MTSTSIDSLTLHDLLIIAILCGVVVLMIVAVLLVIMTKRR
jgi:hypothetical protein